MGGKRKGHAQYARFSRAHTVACPGRHVGHSWRACLTHGSARPGWRPCVTPHTHASQHLCSSTDTKSKTTLPSAQMVSAVMVLRGSKVESSLSSLFGVGGRQAWGLWQRKLDDMHFLKHCILPLFADSLLVHSSFPVHLPHRPFPAHPPWQGHVGQQVACVPWRWGERRPWPESQIRAQG